jgi:hypothetical protein
MFALQFLSFPSFWNEELWKRRINSEMFLAELLGVSFVHVCARNFIIHSFPVSSYWSRPERKAPRSVEKLEHRRTQSDSTEKFPQPMRWGNKAPPPLPSEAFQRWLASITKLTRKVKAASRDFKLET